MGNLRRRTKKYWSGWRCIVNIRKTFSKDRQIVYILHELQNPCENDSLYNPQPLSVFTLQACIQMAVNMGGLDAMYKCNLKKLKSLRCN
jgi:phosphoserine aminotransferase